jgi:alkylated DNA repair protein alkB family protein 1
LVEPKATEAKNLSMSMWELWKHEHGFPSRLSSTECEGLGSLGSGKNRRFYKSFNKLAWATMGYRYDWTAREYHEDDWSPIPTDLVRLSQHFAAAEARCRRFTRKSEARGANDRHLEHSMGDNPPDLTTDSPFQPSACIVNFYSSKSVMGGHRDDSEFAIHQPIVSFSAGRPAVFLLGGPTRDDPVVAPIVVRPGDVMMMGGSTRLNYHAMARLLPADALPQAESGPPAPAANGAEPAAAAPHLQTRVPDSERFALRKFLESHRINVNLRQVYS